MSARSSGISMPTLEDCLAPQPETPPDPEPAWEWGVIEVYGHRSHAGRYREEERFGSKMMRIDVPTTDPDGTKAMAWTTRWYAGGALFSVTPTTEEYVLKNNRFRSENQPHRLTFADDHTEAELEFDR